MWSKWISSILATAQMSPGTASCDLDLRLAAQQVQVARPDRLAALADVELRARRDAALVHAEHREAADVGVDLDLEHVGERVPARIGHGGDLGRLAAAGGMLR